MVFKEVNLSHTEKDHSIHGTVPKNAHHMNAEALEKSGQNQEAQQFQFSTVDEEEMAVVGGETKSLLNPQNGDSSILCTTILESSVQIRDGLPGVQPSSESKVSPTESDLTKGSNKWRLLRRFRRRGSNASSNSSKSLADRNPSPSIERSLQAYPRHAPPSTSSQCYDLSIFRTNAQDEDRMASETREDATSVASKSSKSMAEWNNYNQSSPNGAAIQLDTTAPASTKGDTEISAPTLRNANTPSNSPSLFSSSFDSITSRDIFKRSNCLSIDDDMIQQEAYCTIPFLAKVSSLSGITNLTRLGDAPSVQSETKSLKSTLTYITRTPSISNHLQNDLALECKNGSVVTLQESDLNTSVKTKNSSRSFASTNVGGSSSSQLGGDEMVEKEICLIPFLRMESDLSSHNSVVYDGGQSVVTQNATAISASDEGNKSSSFLCFDVEPQVYEQITMLREMRGKPVNVTSDASEISSLGTLGHFSVNSVTDACAQELPFALGNFSRDLSFFAHDLLRGVFCIVEEQQDTDVASANEPYLHDDIKDVSPSSMDGSLSEASDKWSQVLEALQHNACKCVPVNACK